MTPRDRAGLMLFTIVTAIMVIRLPVGLDLSDESYYAIFLDDWLKGGIRTSTLLTLHQTAALLLYPFAKLYVALAGSTDGLLLFLRALFLLGSLLNAVIWVRLLLRLDAGLSAWCIGAALIAFIPFGLPGPSYNTIGQQGLGIALAAWGLASLTSLSGERSSMLAVSISAAVLCCIAYPPLVLPVGMMALLMVLRPTMPRSWGYLLALSIGGAAALCVTLWVLTPQKIWDSVTYLAAINDPTGFPKKLAFAAQLLGRNPGFILLCLLAAGFGLLRSRLSPFAASVGLAAIMLATFAHPTVLYAKSHDAVTVAMLSGLFLLIGLRKAAPERERIIAIIYATSLLAAAATSAAATFPLYTICIGGLPAAILALQVRPSANSVTTEVIRSLPALSMLPSLLATSLFAPYGEIPSSEPRQWIRDGFFRGLLAKPRDIAAVDLVGREVEPLLGPDRTIAAFGRLPGLVLASSARVRAPTSFPLMPDVPPQGLAATRTFYESKDNRPSIVLVYRDPYFQPTNPMGLDFHRWYREEKRLPTPLGELEIYSRRETTTP